MPSWQRAREYVKRDPTEVTSPGAGKFDLFEHFEVLPIWSHSGNNVLLRSHLVREGRVEDSLLAEFFLLLCFFLNLVKVLVIWDLLDFSSLARSEKAQKEAHCPALWSPDCSEHF